MNEGRIKTLLGGETEYAIGATRPGGETIGQGELLRTFMDCVSQSLPYTTVSVGGRFLRNGGMLYLDCGLHMEWATPECTSPHDVVRYLRAGDRIVQAMAEQYIRRAPDVADVFCSRCNVDYLSHTAWASHESYLHRTAPERLPAQLIPFLASRVILAGAGGWDCEAPGLRFTLSPRAGFITKVTSPDSQHVRPLFHTKDENLSSTGSHRLHVACSETLCSDLATFLRFGTTSLVLALVNGGASPGDAVALRSPLTALRRFAEDPGCRAWVPLADGRRVTAIDIQRHYLTAVEERLGTRGMPEWAGSVCALWRRTLDDLEADPVTCGGRLDWTIKQRVYAEFLRRHGIEWSSLPVLNAALERRLSANDAAQPMPAKLAILLKLRQQLFELDMRFGELGERGVFNALDRAGVLAHRVAGVDDIDAAMDVPPPDTRASVRGEVVRRLTEDGTRYRAEWTQVVDLDHRRVLDLGDPFEGVERWREVAVAV
jgi:proteasome accessory factor A